MHLTLAPGRLPGGEVSLTPSFSICLLIKPASLLGASLEQPWASSPPSPDLLGPDKGTVGKDTGLQLRGLGPALMLSS